MSYLSRNRSRVTRQRLFALFILFIALAFVLSFFDGYVISAVSGIWKSENFVTRGVKNTFGFFKSKDALINENNLLKEQILSLKARVAVLEESGKREAELTSLLNRSDSRQSIAASVIMRPPQTPYDSIIIDAGSSEGVLEGAQVELPEGYPIGTVVEAFPHKSKVKLYSAMGENTPAYLERDNSPVTLVGAGGSNFRIMLPRDAQVVAGDRVLSQDLSSRLVAIVEDIEIKPTDPFKEVLLRAPMSVFNMRFVKVLPQ